MLPADEKAEYFESKDQNLITLVLALGHKCTNYYKKNGIVTVSFDRAEVKAHVDAFYMNLPIPMTDARSFIVAQTIFRSMVKEAQYE